MTQQTGAGDKTNSTAITPVATSAVTINVAGYELAALHKPAMATSAGTQPEGKVLQLLCVHGWLDNANSFIPLLPFLDHYEIVAIDLPGHGHSTGIGTNAYYNLAEAALLLPRVVEALGWQNCHLLGHSLGGNLAVMAAAANSGHFESLILLEALGPLTEDASELPARLAKALEHRMQPQRFQSRIFENPQQAVESRLAAARMTQQAAELIIERQLIEAADGSGWQWRFDHKHRMASPVYLSEQQVNALLASLSLQTLVILANDGYLEKRPETPNRLASIPHLHKANVAGNHHMHMDDPEPTARLIREFLSDPEH